MGEGITEDAAGWLPATQMSGKAGIMDLYSGL